MPEFSELSSNRLVSCHQDLQRVFNEVIKWFDIRITYGHRSILEQTKLYKQGRTMSRGEWLITDRGKILTYCDGTIIKSKHNFIPSHAIDVAPFPIDWEDMNRFILLGGFVLGIAKELKRNGEIENDIVWGGDFNSNFNLKDNNFIDYPHFEIK